MAIRTLRRRRAWRQEDLGRRAGLSRDAVSRAECGELQGLTIGALSRLVDAIDATLVVEVRWRGADLDRLLDGAHAAAQNAAAERLGAAGWLARAEVSFNHFGDRGRCDLLAWHPASRTLLVVEVKSRLGDVQDTLGRLVVKVRLGAVLAQQAGWGRPTRIVRGLVVAEDRTARRILTRHESLFASFGLRGRGALSWLRAPIADVTGLLWFEGSYSDRSRTGGSART
jgi:transcriptional regulator with XRE-family HTH domain